MVFKDIVSVPIEFKEINKEDFASSYSVDDKIIVEPNDNGYISDKLISVINDSLDEKNTVVINAGVGQGKSYSVIQMIQNYVSHNDGNNDYLVVLAVPYLSLINQYCEELVEKTPLKEEVIFNYLKLDDYYFKKESNSKLMGYGFYSDDDLVFEDNHVFKPEQFKVHVTTINGLLGNTGDKHLFRKHNKELYFKALKEYSEVTGKKIILFFDEIHAGIHNFHEEYLYEFWNFKEIIHKQFIVSATFNETSKIVIQYLAEFTDKKVQIIESQRLRIPEKQSKLHLIFNNSLSKNRNREIDDLLKKIIENKNPIDIISYSKSKVKTYYSNGKLFNEDELKIQLNLCYNDVFNNEDYKFNPSMNNFGTNFSTGVNIEKLNHSLVLILPERNNFIDNDGVFSSIPVSIIQAIARQRKVGDIYIIMPKPKYLNIDNMNIDESDKLKLKRIINQYSMKLKDSEGNVETINYTDINLQKKSLEEVYSEKLKKIVEAKAKIKKANRTYELNRLEYPPFEIFAMKYGEEYLKKHFFGGDVATYVFWSAICNQFLNCTLQSIKSVTTNYYETNTIVDYFKEQYVALINSKPFQEDEGTFLSNFKHYNVYKELEIELIGETILLDNKKLDKKQKNKLRFLLMSLVLGFKNEITCLEDLDTKSFRDNVLNTYFRTSMYHSSKIRFNENDEVVLDIGTIKLADEITNNIKAYHKLLKLSSVVLDEVTSDFILEKKSSEKFKNLFNALEVRLTIDNLIERDWVLKEDIFPFRETIKRYDDLTKYQENIYKLLIKVLFETIDKKPEGIRKFSVLKYNVIMEEEVPNLVHQLLPEIIL